jgi:hypothetical protein
MSIQLGTIAGRHRRYLGPGKPRSAINCRSGTRLILDGNALLPGCPAGSGRGVFTDIRVTDTCRDAGVPEWRR